LSRPTAQEAHAAAVKEYHAVCDAMFSGSPSYSFGRWQAAMEAHIATFQAMSAEERTA
jgi:hypothetical protein